MNATTQPPVANTINARLMNAAAKALFTLVLLALVAAALWRVAHWRGFGIAHIAVIGQTAHSNPFGVRSQVLPQLRGNFFTMRLDDVRAAFQSQPWVRSATVRRVFPNQLVVQLQEYEEAAYWGNEEDGYRLLSADGTVFEANPDEVTRENLPELSGPDDAAAKVLATWRQLNPAFAPLHARIARLSVDARGSWSLALDQDTSIMLGNATPEELAARIQQFVQTIGPVIAHYGRGMGDVQYADLRYKSGYAIRLKGVGTVEASATKPVDSAPKPTRRM